MQGKCSPIFSPRCRENAGQFFSPRCKGNARHFFLLDAGEMLVICCSSLQGECWIFVKKTPSAAAAATAPLEMTMCERRIIYEYMYVCMYVCMYDEKACLRHRRLRGLNVRAKDYILVYVCMYVWRESLLETPLLTLDTVSSIF